jgi:hypothetical protein
VWFVVAGKGHEVADVAACPWVVCVVTTRAGRQGSVTEAHGSVSRRERVMQGAVVVAGPMRMLSRGERCKMHPGGSSQRRDATGEDV